MILYKRATDIRKFLDSKRNLETGFVPTMGALHEGHLSLIEQAKEECDLVVCSIFVNPTQFNDPKDLEKYPRPIERDIEMLAGVDCDILFLPSVDEIYPAGVDHLKDFDLGHLENFLEGKSRPGHFKGVANVLDRFLEILSIDRLYLGQKDFQQVKVIDRLIKVTNRNTEIVMCPILREPNGLAMSSRNVRLSTEQRNHAAAISKTLFDLRDHFSEKPLAEAKAGAISYLNSLPDFKVDYLEFCDADTFQTISSENEAKHIVAVIVVIVGGVRLLDNVMVR